MLVCKEPLGQDDSIEMQVPVDFTVLFLERKRKVAKEISYNEVSEDICIFTSFIKKLDMVKNHFEIFIQNVDFY